MPSLSLSTIPTSFITLIAFLLLISPSQARDFVVGGSHNSWTLPLPSPDYLTRWAQSQRFRVGDSLLWNYNKRSESVLEVKEEHYGSCNISDPIAQYNDGNTKVELDRSGPFYFISGAESHCQKGLKVAVVVMSSHHSGRHDSSPAPSPAPSTEAAAPAPHSGGAARFGGGAPVLVCLVLGIGVTLVMMTMV